MQPSFSDSAHTLPSPVSYSKPRLSRSTTHSTHRSQRRSDSHRSTSTVPNPQFKRERERQLANVPRDTLLQHTISKEYELREAKHLLTTALIQLEAIREKFIHEHDTRLSLEDEKKQQAVKNTKALIDTQQDAMDAKEEVRRFQLQLENSQSELYVFIYSLLSFSFKFLPGIKSGTSFINSSPTGPISSGRLFAPVTQLGISKKKTPSLMPAKRVVGKVSKKAFDKDELSMALSI